jgi:quinol monooxygenase YgiN
MQVVTADNNNNRYADKAALGAHGKSPEFKTMFAKINAAGMKDGKVEMKFLKAAGGFASRL